MGFLSENTESAFTSGDAREHSRAETRASRYNVNNGRVNSPYGMSAPRPEATRIVNVEPPHVSSTARFKQSNWKQEKTAFGVGDLGACRRYDIALTLYAGLRPAFDRPKNHEQAITAVPH